MTPRWPETLAPSGGPGGPGAPGAPPAGSAARDAVSVAEAVRVHLPGGRLRGGAAGLTRRVTWATSLRSLPPAFEPRGGGELVLASHSALESLRQADGALTLVRVLEGLAGAGAAALVVAGPVPRDAARTADALGLPLVELPLGAPLLDAERGIIGFVLGRHSELQAQASDLYRRLAQLAVENRGLEAIVREAALATGRVAAFEDARFFLRTTAAPPGVTPPVLDGAGLSSADERGRLGEALRSQPVSTMAPVATLLPAARWGMVRYAAPVVTRERVRGFVSLCQPLAEGDLAEFDQLAASRTASLLAIELAKEDAVQAAEQRIQGDLVDELLHPFDAEGAGRRAAQAGLAAGGTFAVYALALEGSPDGHAGVNLVTSASAAAAADRRGRRPRRRGRAPPPAGRTGGPGARRRRRAGGDLPADPRGGSRRDLRGQRGRRRRIAAGRPGHRGRAPGGPPGPGLHRRRRRGLPPPPAPHRPPRRGARGAGGPAHRAPGLRPGAPGDLR